MRKYVAPEGLEVAGVTALSYIDNIASDSYQPLIEKHGLENLEEEKWYPLQPFFNFFNEIVEMQGTTQPFVAMGMKIADHSIFPPEMIGQEVSMVQIIEGWQDHYAVNHRGADLIPVKSQKVADRHYQLILDKDHHYPFDLVYGLAFGFCRRMLPEDTDFEVSYDETHSPYNEDYGDKVIINISWS